MSDIYNIFHWNTLASKYATDDSFPKVKKNILNWNYRFTHIFNIINECKADIICLAEIDNFEFYRDNIFNHTDIKYELSYSRNPESPIGIIVALNPKKFSFISNNYYSLRSDINGKKGKQIFVYSELLSDKGNKICLIVTHLKSKKENEEIRQYQVEDILKEFGEKVEGKLPGILLGDLNAEPTYPCIQSILNYNNNALKPAHDYKQLEYTTYKIRKDLQKRIIDYIFYYNFNDKIKVIEAEKGKPNIKEDEGLPNESFPSDHVFLKVKFKLN